MELDTSEKLQSLKEILDSNNDRLRQIEVMEKEIELSKWLLDSFDIMSGEKAEFREIFHREIHSSKKSLHQLEGKYTENKFEVEKKRIMRQNTAILTFIETTFGKKAAANVERETTPAKEKPAAESGEGGREGRLSDEEINKIVEELEEKEAELEKKEIELQSKEVALDRREAEIRRITSELERGSVETAIRPGAPAARHIKREPAPQKSLKLPPEIPVETSERKASAVGEAARPAAKTLSGVEEKPPKAEEAAAIPVVPHDEEVAVQSFYGASTDYAASEAEMMLDFPETDFEEDASQLPPEITMVLEMPSEAISSIEMPPAETAPPISSDEAMTVEMPAEAPSEPIMPADDLESFIDAVKLPEKRPEKADESQPAAKPEVTPALPQQSKEETKELKLPVQGPAAKSPQKTSVAPPRRSVEESLKALELLVRKREEPAKAAEEVSRKTEEAPKKTEEAPGRKKRKLSALNVDN
jgi:hypothetical protein